jgi:integrase/recombinase XerD
MSESNMYAVNGTWYLRAEIAGRKYRESLHTANVRDARRLRDARLRTIEAQARHGAVDWRKAVVAWAEHQKGQIAAATLTRYLQSLSLCEPHLNDRMVGEIDGAIVRALVAARRRVVGIATVRRDLTAVSRVLAYAQSVGWREGNPALDAIRLLRERRDPITLPDEDSIQAVLDKCSPHLRNLVIAARLTGARQAELTALKWSQFNEAAGTLEILKGKGNRRRVIKLSDAALAHIAGLDRSGDLIFPSADGPWVSVPPAFAKTVRRAGPRVQFRFHDMRHLYAVESLRSGMSIYRVSQHLGHTSVKTTELYLAHLTPDEADRARQG